MSTRGAIAWLALIALHACAGDDPATDDGGLRRDVRTGDTNTGADSSEPVDAGNEPVDAGSELDAETAADATAAIDATTATDALVPMVDARPPRDVTSADVRDAGPGVDATPSCTAASCNDGNPCTDDVCVAGACTHPANTQTCAGGRCAGGACVPSGTGCGGFTSELGPPDYSGETRGAVPTGANATQTQAVVRANRWRTAAGLAPLDARAELHRAAQNHASFCAQNSARQSTCWPNYHDEVNASVCTGFTGASAGDRLSAEGYRWSTWSEDMIGGTDPSAAVDGWIWTPYHRRPILSRDYVHVGYGVGGPQNVMDFASTGGTRAAAPAVSVFPVPGQTAVPPSFSGNESPRPPTPPTGWPSGTVISVGLNANGTVTEHQLWDASCTAVAHTFSNATGFGGTSPQYFFFYANRPLARNTRYTARVVGTVGTANFARTWVFTTAP